MFEIGEVGPDGHNVSGSSAEDLVSDVNPIGRLRIAGLRHVHI